MPAPQPSSSTLQGYAAQYRQLRKWVLQPDRTPSTETDPATTTTTAAALNAGHRTRRPCATIATPARRCATRASMPAPRPSSSTRQGYTAQYRQLRKWVLQRDRYACVLCG